MTRRRTAGAAASWWGSVSLLVLLSAGVAAEPPQTQQPVFRASVDLVAVDVQVVDDNGLPIAALGPDKFNVTIDGKRRKVVAADFVKMGAPESTVERRAPTIGAVSSNMWPVTTPGRIYVLAVDLASFGVEDTRGAMAAARAFVEELQSNDLVGLYSFPIGPKIDPTLDHRLIMSWLDRLVGSRQENRSVFNLTASEVIDVNAEANLFNPQLTPMQRANGAATTDGITSDTPTIDRVLARECGATAAANDVTCAQQITQEAAALGIEYEGQVMDSLTQLRELLTRLGGSSGRKTVVVLSAGMPSSDRPGGRPDVASSALDIGQRAAEANSTIYALHIDSTYLRESAAETRKADPMPINKARDETVEWRLLDQFSGASGGTLFRVLVGDGEGALDRVLRETSAYYLLGVEPVDADRDGHTRKLKVQVNASGVTVRSRTWVSLPKK